MSEVTKHTIEVEKRPAPTAGTVAAKVGVWVLVFAVLSILRPFFLLIFLTFIFSYIQAQAVARLERRIPNRTLRVILVGLGFLGLIVGAGNFLAPRVQSQAETFAMRYPEYLRNLDSSIVNASRDHPIIERIFPQISELRDGPPGGVPSWNMNSSVSARIIQDMLGVELGQGKRVSHIVEKLRELFARIVASISAFLLSLLFSFLIVLDLPRLAAAVRGLRHTKLKFLYEEIIPTMVSFGAVMGRALEAQVVIALVNTILTAIGVYLLGLGDNVAFFSVIVFLCSFIPTSRREGSPW